MGSRRGPGPGKWPRRLVALAVILALVPGCQLNLAQFYIPLAYAATGLCVALLMSPTPVAAVVGFAVGGLLGAAVYNNSLKRQIMERQRTEPRGTK